YLDTGRVPWRLQGEALRMWNKQARAWKRQEREGASETDQVLDALSKADTQALRLALVLSEVDDAYNGGVVMPDAMEAAIAITDYGIGVWRYLTPGEYLAKNAGDLKLFRAAEAWHTRVVGAGGELMLSELIRSKVGGVRNAEQAEDVLDEYKKHWQADERKSR